MKDRTFYINVLICYILYWSCLFTFCLFDALGFGGPEDPRGTIPPGAGQLLEIAGIPLQSALSLSYANQPIQNLQPHHLLLCPHHSKARQHCKDAPTPQRMLKFFRPANPKPAAGLLHFVLQNPQSRLCLLTNPGASLCGSSCHGVPPLLETWG